MNAVFLEKIKYAQPDSIYVVANKGLVGLGEQFDRYLETCSYLQEFQLRQLGATTLETFRTDMVAVPEKGPEKKTNATVPKKQQAKGKLEEKGPVAKQLPATTHPLPGWLEALWYTVPEVYKVCNAKISVSDYKRNKIIPSRVFVLLDSMLYPSLSIVPRLYLRPWRCLRIL